MKRNGVSHPGGLRPCAHAPRGFSLVELLVAMVIFTTLMGGILVLFVGSMRAVSQGRQSINGYEMARGTMMVLEDDLTTGFTARDFSDSYQMYGTPIGMVFVGTSRGSATGSADKTGAPGLARISYVLYTYRNQVDGVPDPIPGALEYVARQDGRTYDMDSQPYLLLRYVEPNISDISKFPLDWVYRSDGTPRLTQSGEKGVAEDVLEKELYRLGQEYDSQNFDVFLSAIGASAPTPAAIRQAKRCELWLTMLAGGRAKRDASDYEIPSAWVLLNKNPMDYVLCESVMGLAPRISPTGQSSGYPVPALQLPPNGLPTVFGRDADPFAGTGSGWNEIWFSTNSSLNRPGFGGSPLFNYRVSAVTYASQDKIPTWWNDPIKMLSLLRLRWEDERAQYESDPVALDNAKKAFASEAKLYLSSRLPTNVGLKMRVIMPATYPGAADFNRDFSLDVNIPTGYARQGQLPAAQ